MSELTLRQEIMQMDAGELAEWDAMVTASKRMPCIGKIYRARFESFINVRDGVEFRTRFNLLKRRSCKKEYCEVCNAMDDQLADDIQADMIFGVDDVEHGKLYKLEWFEYDRDLETGIKEYMLKFNEVKE